MSDKYIFIQTIHLIIHIINKRKKKYLKKNMLFLPLNQIQYKIFIHNNPSEGENELLPWKGLSFQTVQIRKRKSLWAFSRIDTLASSLTRSSIHPHRWRVELSIIIKTLKITSMKKRSWSSMIIVKHRAISLISKTIITCFIGEGYILQLLSGKLKL